MNKRLRGFLSLALLLPAGVASGASYEWGDIEMNFINRFTLGAGWRVEDRDNANVGILNVPGQQELCTVDDCLNFSNNPAPNQRLLDAEGGHFLHVTDDGNLNYDKGDLYTGGGKLNTEFTANWGDWTFKTSFIGFVDQVNLEGEYHHTNTRWQGPTTQRNDDIHHRLSMKGEIREFFIARPFEIGEYELFVSAGRQRIRWGEANLHLFNTLDVINPLDAVLARQPGFSLNELNVPVGMVTFGMDVIENVSVEPYYQFEWRAARPEPAGSYYSTSDLAGGGTQGELHLGQFSEDPNALYTPASTSQLGLVSNSHRTIYLPDDEAYAPDNGGEYGVRVKWYLPDFNNGTELGFYYSNYHSRLPFASGFAAAEGCARNANDFIEALAECDGFNSPFHAGAERCEPPGCFDDAAYIAREPFPVDTARLFLDYPEDIQMFGVSFNTTAFGWSVSGEYSFRPNMPAQLLISDVLFTLEQPAVPRGNLALTDLGAITPGDLLALLGNTESYQRALNLLTDLLGQGIDTNLQLPGARTIFPDYISGYRGYDNNDPNNDIAGGQYIPGYERLKTGQFMLTALKLFSTNPLKSDDILLVLEAGFCHIVDMPKPGELYFQGTAEHTHPSPASDGTGFAPGQPVDTRRINPTTMTSGWADDFSWGTRALVQLNYSNVFDIGLTIKPTLFAFVDIEGIAPSPAQNYVEGNRWIIGGAFWEFGESLGGTLLYQHFDGKHNLLSDRDSLSFTVTYSF